MPKASKTQTTMPKAGLVLVGKSSRKSKSERASTKKDSSKRSSKKQSSSKSAKKGSKSKGSSGEKSRSKKSASGKSKSKKSSKREPKKRSKDERVAKKPAAGEKGRKLAKKKEEKAGKRSKKKVDKTGKRSKKSVGTKTPSSGKSKDSRSSLRIGASSAAPTAGGRTPASNKNITNGIVPTPTATHMCDDWIETMHNTSIYLPPVYRRCLVQLIHGFGDRREIDPKTGVPLGLGPPVAWAMTMVKRLLVMWRALSSVHSTGSAMQYMRSMSAPCPFPRITLRPQASLVMKPDFMLEQGLVRRYFEETPLPLEECIAEAREVCVAQNWADSFALLFNHAGGGSWLHAPSAHSPQILRLLLDHHYNVGAMNGGGRDGGKAEVRRRVNEALKNDTTPLMCAACEGNTVSTQMLLEGGADVNTFDSQGYTARVSVKSILEHEKALEVLRILYDHSPKETMDFLVTYNSTVNEFISIFAVACRFQRTPDLLKWLLALLEPTQLQWDAAMEGAIGNPNGTKVMECFGEEALLEAMQKYDCSDKTRFLCLKWASDNRWTKLVKFLQGRFWNNDAHYDPQDDPRPRRPPTLAVGDDGPHDEAAAAKKAAPQEKAAKKGKKAAPKEKAAKKTKKAAPKKKAAAKKPKKAAKKTTKKALDNDDAPEPVSQ